MAKGIQKTEISQAPTRIIITEITGQIPSYEVSGVKHVDISEEKPGGAQGKNQVGRTV